MLFPSRLGGAETPPAVCVCVCVLRTHHRDLIPLDADVRASEVAQSGDGGDAGHVHQVAIVVQHVNVHSDLPHLKSSS